MAKYTGGLEDSLDLPPASITVLESRYLNKDPEFLKKDPETKIIGETAEQMYRRVAKDIAAADGLYLEGLKDKANRDTPTEKLYEIVSDDPRIKAKEEQFFDLMTQGYFLPNSPTLMNAGNGLQQLAGCFVLPVEDDMREIFNAIRDGALVHKSGGGTGYSFSRLRPRNSAVGSTGGVASGPLSFASVFDAATETIKQGGKRRGANMGTLRVDHPDILEFIDAKKNSNKFNNFNFSVGATDEFMNAVKEERNYDLINPKTKEAVGQLNAKEVYNRIMQNVWENGEPGVLFLDTANKYNPTPQLGEYETTNPCGEQWLLPNESCNLGAINMGKMVTPEGKLDKETLEKTVRSCVRYLDNVIDRCEYPLEEITKMVLGNRKIGLGIMGGHDYLIQRGILYGSPEGREAAKEFMSFIHEISQDESRILAEERGVFPNWEESIYGPNGKNIKLRNAALTTIAPTGTTAIINGNASSGCEPLFDFVYTRKVEDTIGTNLIEINNLFKKWLIENHPEGEKIIERIYAKEFVDDKEMMSSKYIPMSEDLRKKMKLDGFERAEEISARDHVLMQATLQKNGVDSSISKTINAPNSATVEDLANLYMLAWEEGCKGVTIYRDGSRDNQVLNSGSVKSGLEKKVNGFPKNRPSSLDADVFKFNNGEEKWIAFVGCYEGRPYEIFTGKSEDEVLAVPNSVQKGRIVKVQNGNGSHYDFVFEDRNGFESKVGGISHQFKKEYWNYARLTSALLREGVPIIGVINTVAKLVDDGGENINTWKAGVKRILSKYVEDGTEVKDLCPDCGTKLRFEEGCIGCSCGYSKCS